MKILVILIIVIKGYSINLGNDIFNLPLDSSVVKVIDEQLKKKILHDADKLARKGKKGNLRKGRYYYEFKIDPARFKFNYEKGCTEIDSFVVADTTLIYNMVTLDDKIYRRYVFTNRKVPVDPYEKWAGFELVPEGARGQVITDRYSYKGYYNEWRLGSTYGFPPNESLDKIFRKIKNSKQRNIIYVAETCDAPIFYWRLAFYSVGDKVYCRFLKFFDRGSPHREIKETVELKHALELIYQAVKFYNNQR